MNDTHPALYWRTGNGGSVRCELCPHGCDIPSGGTGFCGVRENRGGALYAAGYGRISAAALDPIEKKPLYRFHPGSRILSLGSFGCNLRCPFCQNCDISVEYGSRRQDARTITPEEAAALALETAGNTGVAYTYNEPLIGYEFVYDCSKRIREVGLRNVLVTNGYINREPMEALLPFIDAMNIDLKGFTGEFYQTLRGGPEPVKETVILCRKHCHVEVTTLVIPGENENDIEAIAAWLASLDPEIPLHLSRFFPRYRYAGREPTPKDTMLRLGKAAEKYLRHVYLGNM